ncbi:MAG: LacI family DNA-binding transcriptional regulator [Spirochaetales bacterium]
MVTIQDVAKAAGVANSTVSHALNGKRTISQATKEKIFQAIKDLGYEPNPNARALRSSSTGVIGFFAYDITEVFAARIIQGAEKIARRRNAYLLFTSGVEFNYDIHGAVDFLRKRRVDGIIIAYGVRQTVQADFLHSLEMPIVTVNTRVHETIPSVQPDDFAGGKEAALHLLSRGCRYPAVIAGPESRLASEERLAGFLEALEDNNIPFDASKQVIHGDFSADSGARCMETLLLRFPEFDAVFCANDYMAAGAINQASARGLSVPNDIKIIGFDNREFGAFWPIPITTFALPLLTMGEKSAEMLFERIEGRYPEPMHVTLPSNLIQRSSS